MKFLSALLLSIFVFNTHAACDDHEEGSKESTSQSAPYTKFVKLSGMSCGSCVKNVTKELKSVQLEKGVELKIEVNSIAIDYSKNKDISAEQLDKILADIKSALSKTSYKVLEG